VKQYVLQEEARLALQQVCMCAKCDNLNVDAFNAFFLDQKLQLLLYRFLHLFWRLAEIKTAVITKTVIVLRKTGPLVTSSQKRSDRLSKFFYFHVVNL